MITRHLLLPVLSGLLLIIVSFKAVDPTRPVAPNATSTVKIARPLNAPAVNARGADPSPAPADEVIQSACKEAATTHKKVFIMFHASWCIWCHRMDTAMADPACKKLFEDNYVIRHLTIQERGDKKSLENPGAQALYDKYANANDGIPFWMVINADGSFAADSHIKKGSIAPGAGQNTGFPGAKEEVAYFIRVLQATSSLNSAQLKTIEDALARHKG